MTAKLVKSRSKLGQIYHSIKQRCTNEKSKSYYKYGAIGVSICNEWKDNSDSFYSWALSNGYEEGLTIDRINNDGNYEPSNCRWVNRQIQAINKGNYKSNTSGIQGVSWYKRNNKWKAQISYKGKVKHIGYFDTRAEAAIAYEYAKEKRNARDQ